MLKIKTKAQRFESLGFSLAVARPCAESHHQPRGTHLEAADSDAAEGVVVTVETEAMDVVPVGAGRVALLELVSLVAVVPVGMAVLDATGVTAVTVEMGPLQAQVAWPEPVSVARFALLVLRVLPVHHGLLAV